MSRRPDFERFSDVDQCDPVHIVTTAIHLVNVYAFVSSSKRRFVDQIQICPQYKFSCLSIVPIRRPLFRSPFGLPANRIRNVSASVPQFTTSKSSLQQVIICSVLRLEPLSTIQGCFNRVYVLAHAQTKSTILGYQVDSCMV